MEPTKRRSGNIRGRVPNGQKIRRLRINRGLTPAEFSQLIGLKRDTIYRIELYNMPVAEVRVAKMARALGLVDPQDDRARVEEILADGETEDSSEDDDALRPTG